MKTKIKQSINFYYYIPYLAYLIPFMMLLGVCLAIKENPSLTAYDIILPTLLIIMFTGFIHKVITDIKNERETA